MSDVGEHYKSMRAERQKAAQQNRRGASADFFEAVKYASERGMIFVRRSASHYQLRVYAGTSRDFFWLYNLYPGNQRIWIDRQHKGPFLNFITQWTFKAVIIAAAKARKKYANNRIRKTET